MGDRESFKEALRGGGEEEFLVCAGALLLEPVKEAILRAGVSSEEILSDPKALSTLSLATAELLGADNLSLPFRMTVESEAYGGEPLSASAMTGGGGEAYRYPLCEIGDWHSLKPMDLSQKNFQLVFDTIKELRRARPDTPIVADLVGPLGLATSLVDTAKILKAMVPGSGSGDLCAMLDFLVEDSIRYLDALSKAGADSVFIIDPASTAELLGPVFFYDYSVAYLNRLTNAAHAKGLAVIVHISGGIEGIEGAISKLLKADGVSFDPALSSKEQKGHFSGLEVVELLDGGRALSSHGEVGQKPQYMV